LGERGRGKGERKKFSAESGSERNVRMGRSQIREED